MTTALSLLANDGSMFILTVFCLHPPKSIAMQRIIKLTSFIQNNLPVYYIKKRPDNSGRFNTIIINQN